MPKTGTAAPGSKHSSRPSTAASSQSEELSPSAAKAKGGSLRDAIAKARAAKAASMRKGSVGTSEGGDTGDFPFTDDPFNTGLGGSNEKVLRKRVKAARSDGKLNISMMDLKEIPKEVYAMYERGDDDDDDGDGPKWYEAMDLVKLIAADNEISEVGDTLVDIFETLAVLDVHFLMRPRYHSWLTKTIDAQ